MKEKPATFLKKNYMVPIFAIMSCEVNEDTKSESNTKLPNFKSAVENHVNSLIKSQNPHHHTSLMISLVYN